jgi:D-alanine--D-alanine ligase
MKLLDQKVYHKIKKLNICLVTGTGKVDRKSKADLVAEEDAFTTSRELLKLMLEEGFKYTDYFTATEDNLSALKFLKPDVFLNLAEGTGLKFISRVIRVLEETGLPFTGSTEKVNSLSTDKNQAKIIFQKNKIPTPPSFLLTKNNLIDFNESGIGYPLILKPVLEDGSTGINQHSVVTGRDELLYQAKKSFDLYDQPILVEKYIASREFSVTLYEDNGKIKILPVSELVYKKTAQRKWNIYTYQAKWFYKSKEYFGTPSVAPPKNMSRDDLKKITDVSVAAFNLFQIRDYARVDLRYDTANQIPYVLEINTNPSLEIDGKYSLSTSVTAAKLTMAQFAALLIKSALLRFGKTI